MASTITLVGAGLVGSLLSIFLAQKGHRVQVYEKRPDYRKVGAAGGRSINLALSERGWRSLHKAGLEEKIRQLALPMYGRMIHDTAGKLTFQPYGKENQAIYSVSRALLNEVLVSEAEKYTQVNFNFNQTCLEVDLHAKKAIFEDSQTKEQAQVQSDLIIGADGAFSAVRQAMQHVPRFNYSQHYLEHGYKELSIPPNTDGSHRLAADALHIWPRRSFMLIALPNLDGSFTCTLFLRFEGAKDSFENLITEKQIRVFFETHFADVLPLMPTLIEDFNTNPTSSLVTVRCNPWIVEDKAVLIGDAAHAIVPFYGQGMNAGFEDCFYFNQFMNQYQDWKAILEAYQKERIRNGNAIADLALQNFVEMRDSVADENFLLRKKIEAKLHDEYPNDWIPQYTMVTFSHLPYQYALDMGKKQAKIMDEIMQLPTIQHSWQSMDFSEYVKRLKQKD